MPRLAAAPRRSLALRSPWAEVDRNVLGTNWEWNGVKDDLRAGGRALHPSSLFDDASDSSFVAWSTLLVGDLRGCARFRKNTLEEQLTGLIRLAVLQADQRDLDEIEHRLLGVRAGHAMSASASWGLWCSRTCRGKGDTRGDLQHPQVAHPKKNKQPNKQQRTPR